jgi:hypothetical protein
VADISTCTEGEGGTSERRKHPGTLDAEEENAIELKREVVNGQEQTNPSRSMAAREFEFKDTEIARIKVAIETWAQYGAAADRRWLEPLVDALFLG